MATPFSGNATLTAGNAASLLAVSNIVFAGNTTIRTNGAAYAPFDFVLAITPSDPANFTCVAAANATQAANVPAGLGLKCVSGGFYTVSPAEVINAVNAGTFAGAGNISRADAGNVYVATSANQTLSFKGY